jgi:hypothetical protein
MMFWKWLRRCEGDAPGPRIPTDEIRDWVRAGIGEVAARHGFRRARDSKDAWVRPSGEGVLELVQLLWV